jgi:ATP-binding cassette subfamily A (ABC1) protein 3
MPFETIAIETLGLSLTNDQSLLIGNGYTIKLAARTALNIPLSGPVEIEESRNQMVYRVGTSSLAAEAVQFLESREIDDYQISGPTMEELFLKATGDKIGTTEEDSTLATNDPDSFVPPTAIDANSDNELVDGRPISVYKQWYILLGKRFRILRRRYVPYIVAVGFAIVGAGIAPLLIKSFKKPMQCPTIDDLISDDNNYRYDFGSGTYGHILVGPPDKVNDQWLERIANIYSANHSRMPEYYGYANVSDFQGQVGVINSYDEMLKNISDSQKSTVSYLQSAASINGGLWLGDDDEPVIFINVLANQASNMLNLLTNIVSGVDISTGYYQFGQQQMPPVYDVKPMLFMSYYGLIMAVYPAFFAVRSHCGLFKRRY